MPTNKDTIRWLARENIEPAEQLAQWTLPNPISPEPSFGYTVERLLNIHPIPELPEGGERFWRDRYQQALTVAPEITWEGEQEDLDNGTLRILRFNTTRGRRLGAWLGLPKSGVIKRLVVFGHGYGGQVAPTTLVLPDTAFLYFCFRGQNALSKFPDIPSIAFEHVLVGIEDKETYIHGHNAEDLWCAVSALRSLYPDTSLPLFYHGGSFGGGIGALAIPWDDRIKKAYLRVPSFGNHPLRLTMPCSGSGKSVRAKWLENPEILANTLRWHDAAATIRHAQQPILFACALLDPSVPPPGQFSIWKAHAGPSRLLIVPAGHFVYPGEQEILQEILREIDQFFW